MFRIDPNSLYTRADLQRELGGIQSVETFLEPLDLENRLYKKAYQGEELLDAMREARERQRRAATVPSARQKIEIRKARPGETFERVHISRK